MLIDLPYYRSSFRIPVAKCVSLSQSINRRSDKNKRAIKMKPIKGEHSGIDAPVIRKDIITHLSSRVVLTVHPPLHLHCSSKMVSVRGPSASSRKESLVFSSHVSSSSSLRQYAAVVSQQQNQKSTIIGTTLEHCTSTISLAALELVGQSPIVQVLQAAWSQ